MDEWDLPGMVKLAKASGVLVRRVDPRLLRGSDACLIRLHGQHEIFVARKMSPERFHWAVAHELAELRLRLIGYEEPDVELVADSIAAALVMPSRVYREAIREHEGRLENLAVDFLVDQTAAALRLAEIREAEAAVVVTPQRVHARLSQEWALPDEREIRRGRLTKMPGVETVALTDAKRRTAFLVR